MQRKIDVSSRQGKGKCDHDHESNLDLIRTTCFPQTMKERVLNELTTIGIIYEEEMAKSALSAAGVVTFPTKSRNQTFGKVH
ncbi:unnamed protein product [Rotaria sordida]|uniref:Uncharacterized protein n=1 Tax=Rotaria sordida TaxID=392033 RepID=A0A814Y044_9BILA|nr:unnamed protein product [Rotaria sordida]CAF1224042.1 unnamed protein product [Rotaria sordida]CAF3856463.1 unnamed protein product [Rotaria sordida]